MILSKKSRYGLRALIDLAANTGENHIALNVLAERNKISAQYLEQVFAALRRAGIVRSIKGPQGGYLLKRHASQITAAQILTALDGTYHVDNEPEHYQDGTPRISETIQEKVVKSINLKLDELLENITLEDLLNDYLERTQGSSDMYFI